MGKFDLWHFRGLAKAPVQGGQLELITLGQRVRYIRLLRNSVRWSVLPF